MSLKKSRYKEKFDNGNQMYGPGCCAHKVTPAQVDKVKRDADARGHFRKSPVMPS